MKKRIWWGVLTLGVIALGGMLAGTRSSGTDGPAGETVRVVRRDIGAVVKATGVIKPRVGAEVRVGSRVSGAVEHLYVQIGDTVHKGQMLAQLDERDFVSRRDEAAAALRQAEVNLEYARIERDRRRALLAKGFLSPADADAADRASAVADEQVAAARAALDFATTQLGYARITAPIGGVVASVSTQEGETVAASFAAPTFLTLIDPARLEVWAYVDETDIGRVRVGQAATFTVDTYSDHAFDGRVSAVYPKAEIRDNVVNYIAVIRFAAPRDRTLRPEMTTTVRIAHQLRTAALALPSRAVRWQAGSPYVFARRGGGVERVPITAGIRDESYVEIIAGLRESDTVLIGDTTSTRRRE